MRRRIPVIIHFRQASSAGSRRRKHAAIPASPRSTLPVATHAVRMQRLRAPSLVEPHAFAADRRHAAETRPTVCGRMCSRIPAHMQWCSTGDVHGSGVRPALAQIWQQVSPVLVHIWLAGVSPVLRRCGRGEPTCPAGAGRDEAEDVELLRWGVEHLHDLVSPLERPDLSTQCRTAPTWCKTYRLRRAVCKSRMPHSTRQHAVAIATR